MRSRFTLAALLFLLLAAPVRAALQDEIQVYTDDINKPREFGLELHVNTTPNGVNQPAYPGETTNRHGLRITPEFSYGLSEDFEAGLYLPTSLNNGNWTLAGYKLRLKWLPLKGEKSGGWFAGANLELSNVAPRFEASRHNAELRTIGGYRSKDWLFAINPVFGWALSHSQEVPAPRNPDFSLGYKASRRVAEGVALGLEYYNDKGPLNQFDPGSQQAKTLFWTVDVDRGPVPFNFGVGRGLNGSTDRWTVKMIFEIPLK